MTNTLDILSTAEKMTIDMHGATAALQSISGEIADLEVAMAELQAKKSRAEEDLGQKNADFEKFLDDLPEGLSAEKIKSLSQERVRQLADAGLLEGIQIPVEDEASEKPAAKKKDAPKKSTAKKTDPKAKADEEVNEESSKKQEPAPAKEEPSAAEEKPNAEAEPDQDHDFLQSIADTEGETGEKSGGDSQSEKKGVVKEEVEEKPEEPEKKEVEAKPAAAKKKVSVRPKLRGSKSAEKKPTAPEADEASDAIEKLAAEDGPEDTSATSNDEDLIAELATNVGEDKPEEGAGSDDAGSVEIPEWM